VGADPSSEDEAGTGVLRLERGGLTGLLKLVEVVPVPWASSVSVVSNLRRFTDGTLLPLDVVIVTNERQKQTVKDVFVTLGL
jgi:hypothetical protein